jgi:uncharacterized membrane protein
MNWIYVILIFLIIFIIIAAFSDINVFYSNSCDYENAYCRWDNFKRSMEVEGYVIDLLKVSLQDNGYEFYYSMKKRS